MNDFQVDEVWSDTMYELVCMAFVGGNVWIRVRSRHRSSLGLFVSFDIWLFDILVELLSIQLKSAGVDAECKYHCLFRHSYIHTASLYMFKLQRREQGKTAGYHQQTRSQRRVPEATAGMLQF